MTEQPHEIILDHLRAIRADIGKLSDDVQELKSGQVGIRNQLHGLQGDGLRYERTIATMQAELDRVNRRLELADA